MEGWTAPARRMLEQQDSELQGMTADSDVSEGDRPQPRNRWTVRTLVLGAAFGLAALAAIAVAFAPWTSSVGQPLDRGIEGDHAIALTDDQLEALDSRGSAAAPASIAGPAMLHVDDLNTFESKAAGSPTCEIPCGGGDGTCSSALADLLDGSTGSMPPGSDPSCFGAQELVKRQCPLCSCCGDMCAVSTKLGAAPPGCLNPYTVPIDLFDLNSSHPDMEQSSISGHCTGLVNPVLAPDFTPVLSGNPGSGKCANAITSASSFNDWYHNTANSFPVSSQITLCQDPNTGFFVYDNPEYFAMDGRGWDERMPGKPDHNYHFTMHLHNYFTMQGGEVFTFRGDDDVWVFFSRCDRATGQCEPSKLGIDLGGVHTPIEQTVDLEQLGFNKDDHIRMDFFWAERHTILSNLRIVTNIVFDTETTTTSGTSTTATTTTKTTVTATTTTITGTTTTNTDTETTVTRTETTTTATTTTVTTTTVTTTTVTTTTTTHTTTTLTTTSLTATSVTTTTTVTTTTLGPTTTPSVGPSAAPTMSPATTPNSCEEGCDGMTCAEKLLEILDESGSGSSPPITLPEAVLILIKMCPNCASCDPSGVCPSIVGPADR